MLKLRVLIPLAIDVLLPGLCAAQFNYPYTGFRDNNDLQAYWYNIPADSATMERDSSTRHFHSTLQIYGESPGMDFTVSAQVFLEDGAKTLDRTFEIVDGVVTDSLTTDMGYSNHFFRIIHRVDQLLENPDRILLTLRSQEDERSREIDCRYHRLSGRVTDFEGRPFRAFVSIRPDGFHGVTSVWTDNQGRYELDLPERTYNAIYVDDESYGVRTLEAWGWHIVMNGDQELDFKVGTAEVYNLNAWSNNGGYFTYFISFRPMALMPQEARESRSFRVQLNDRDFEMANLAPDLEIDDITVRINGREAEILNLQRYYEADSDSGIVSYLLQVDKRGTPRNGRISFEVEYEKEMEIEGETVVRNSMGIFQLLPNFVGMSNYH